MNRLLFILCFSLLLSNSFAQSVTIYTDDFEGTLSWTTVGSMGTQNFWRNNTCAGNGPTNGGANAMYISPSSTSSNTTSCSTSGTNHFSYSTPTAPESYLISTAIAACGTNLIASFDYKLAVNDNADLTSVVYSVDNGVTWTVIENLINSAAWTNKTINLPVALNNSAFRIGFQFSANTTVSTGTPIAFDNFKLTGTDAVIPTVTCPGNQSIYSTAACNAVLTDYTGLVTATDDCTASANLIFSQTPILGTTITANTLVTITAKDAANNAGTCSFSVVMIDTLKPTINCVQFTTASIQTPCEYELINLSHLVTVNDNCTPGVNIVITQNPVAGSIINGMKDVIMRATDVTGNFSECIIRVLPLDSIKPVITCPPNATINNGSNCTLSLADYVPQAIYSDNCPYFAVYQYPSAGTSIPAGDTTIKITITDQLGRDSTCSFVLSIIENVAPTVTNCPADITSCNPVVNFATITATDNCLVKVQQTDNTGLASGSTFPVGVSAMQFTAIDSSGNTAVCNFNVTINASPIQPIFPEDTIKVCASTSATIHADGGIGTWSNGIIGTATITDPTNSTSGVTGLTVGTNEFIWTVTSALCGSASSSLKVIVYNNPSIANIVKDTIYSCKTVNTLLSANVPTSGQGLWTTNQAGVVINNATQYNAVASNLAPGWNKFFYTISNGSCPSTRDSVSVFMVKPAVITSIDTSFCLNYTEYVAVGEVPEVGQTAGWSMIQGSGTIASPNSPTTKVTQLRTGTNLLVYSFTHPFCSTTKDTLMITINNCSGDEFVIPTLITPNLDGRNDIFTIDNLATSYPECSVTIVNRYGSIVYQSKKGYDKPWDGTQNGKELPMGTYFYKIELNNDDNTSYSGHISIIR